MYDDSDLTTFEGYIKYQYNIDAVNLTAEQSAELHLLVDPVIERSKSIPKVGLMKLELKPGEEQYGVAIQNDSGVWLALLVKCSKRGEVFIIIPRAEPEWDPHASYHLDGRFHQKSYDRKTAISNRQPLTGVFKGNENLGEYAGHGTGNAECDPAVFNGLITLEPGVLTGRTGVVGVSLFEQGTEPEPIHTSDVVRQVFPRRNGRPSLVITARKT